MASSPHVRKNRRGWNEKSDAYQARHGPQLGAAPMAWGVFSIPEAEVAALGEVADRDVLELGCGGAQWSVALAALGARVTALDASERQLAHARRRAQAGAADVALVHADAERLPFADACFDLVFCDHGATSYTDPERSIPEAARVLRPGGRLAFNVTSALHDLCWDPEHDVLTETLHGDYFGLWGYADPDVTGFQRGYGDWIRLFLRCDLGIRNLIELRAPDGASTTYDDFASSAWARRWPAEHIWVLERGRAAVRGDSPQDSGDDGAAPEGSMNGDPR